MGATERLGLSVQRLCINTSPMPTREIRSGKRYVEDHSQRVERALLQDVVLPNLLV